MSAQDQPSWNCPHCDSPPSYNPNDIEHRYCGHCHHFCAVADLAPHWLVRVSGQAHGKGVLVTSDLDEVRQFAMTHLTAGVQTLTVHRWPAVDWVPPKGWPFD